VQERSGTVMAATQPAKAPDNRSKLHTLATGETLWSVAQRYGVTVEDIQRWNHIKDNRSIPAGKQLVVAAP
jgi:membrane-bound lytic murein transglycosylase D